MAIYLATSVTRTLRRKLPITVFEIAQLALTLTLAIGCGFRVTHGAAIIAVGAPCIAAGVFGYIAAFASRSIHTATFTPMPR